MLQTGSPVVLRVLSTIEGDRDDEAGLHWQFRMARLHGEWFEPVPELVALADANTSQPYVPSEWRAPEAPEPATMTDDEWEAFMLAADGPMVDHGIADIIESATDDECHTAAVNMGVLWEPSMGRAPLVAAAEAESAEMFAVAAP